MTKDDTQTAGFLILAAGQSRRFGDNKLLSKLPHTGMSILETTLNSLPRGYPKQVICRPSQHTITQCLDNLAIVHSGHDALIDGMGASIAYGINQTAHWGGWVICLADMPAIKASTYCQIIDAVKPNNIVIPVTNGLDGDQINALLQRGNPVGFGQHFRDQLKNLKGDQGGKAIVAANTDKISVVEVKDMGILLDIDYPDDINDYVLKQVNE